MMYFGKIVEKPIIPKYIVISCEIKYKHKNTYLKTPIF